MKALSLEEEYEKNSNLRREDVDYVKEWLTKQPHLPNVPEARILLSGVRVAMVFPEEMLVAFLHSCDYKLEATKHAIECHYTLKTQFAELGSHRDPLLPEVRRALQVMQLAMLPGRDTDGHVVLMSRFADVEPSHLMIADATKVFVMFHDLVLQLVGLVPGMVIVIDQKGATVGHVPRFSPAVLKKLLAYLQDGFPGKINGFHIINCMPVTETILNVVRPFLKGELLSKLRVHHTGLKSFYKYIPQEILPQEYGGDAGPFDDLHRKVTEELEEHRDWFLEEQKLRVDESKRLGPDKYITQEFGIVGSFRKLELD